MDGEVRLYYRETFKWPMPKYDPCTETNILIVARLWRWFRAQESGPGSVDKDDLMGTLFRDAPHVTKHSVGRALGKAVPYKMSFQENPRPSNNFTGSMHWRWRSPKDPQYGLEHLMVSSWMTCALKEWDEELTEASYREEFEILRDMTSEDEQQFIEEFSRKRMWRWM
ncbi:MAG: hypothetical protein Tp138OMZ00d2C19078261_2 [Prokaryotic dsDNA virus sp.]|jgi:hypothetical protein|nr:MAG: hypothetical protein Tp138OMZ00d2C19078261_2 [Prokaryotic dsDNA virus sp.]|tara:strand:+ start:10573 stop:11076 length:504 start_codon:yes stop_codon:yes gene_type:complete